MITHADPEPLSAAGPELKIFQPGGSDPFGARLYALLRKHSGFDIITANLEYEAIQKLKVADRQQTLTLLAGKNPDLLLNEIRTQEPEDVADFLIEKARQREEKWRRISFNVQWCMTGWFAAWFTYGICQGGISALSTHMTSLAMALNCVSIALGDNHTRARIWLCACAMLLICVGTVWFAISVAKTAH